MSSITDITDLLTEQGKTFTERHKADSMRFENIEKYIQGIEAKANRPFCAVGSFSPDQEDHRKAFDSYLRKGEADGLSHIQQKAMNSSSDPDAGYLVLPEMDAVIDRIAEDVSAMYRLADVRTIKTAKYEKLVKTSGMAMSRVGDGATAGETTEPTYAKIQIDVHTAEVEPWANNESLEDAGVDLGSDLANEAGIAFAEGGGAEFITGNGVGKARGILSYPIVANSAYAWGSVGFILSGKSAAFTSVAPADKIINLQHSLKQQYRSAAVWLMNDSTLEAVRQIKDASGSYYLWQPDPTAAFGGRLLGNPVEIDSGMPDIAAGSYSIAFGNFKRGYKIVNRAGTTLIRDNLTAKGKTKFNFRRRFGGGIYNFEAIKLMKFATS
ncbi:MAG: phage major capsid protein [Proteobacteria bacterium]|nr:phage major capsid protein [Pseudomonadota bacterium]